MRTWVSVSSTKRLKMAMADIAPTREEQKSDGYVGKGNYELATTLACSKTVSMQAVFIGP